ncbi:MAG TPA: GNAT family N-acetyltransferase [Longimicrobium sp.]|nr:GNAT family N-acetyltransferase [Longimicrobium sp.]
MIPSTPGPEHTAPPPPRGPAYRIVTPRLVVRCWDPADAPALTRAITESLDHLRAWLPWTRDEPEPVEEKAVRLRRFRALFDLDRDYTYGIFDRDGSRVLGGTGTHLRVGDGGGEIGYWIHPGAEGRGLVTEAAAAMVRAGFELHGFGWMEIRCAPGNARSFAVAERLGFVHEATVHEPYELMVWTLLAADYPASPAARVPVEAFDAAGLPLEMAPAA